LGQAERGGCLCQPITPTLGWTGRWPPASGHDPCGKSPAGRRTCQRGNVSAAARPYARDFYTRGTDAMRPSYPDMQRYCPFRPPDWRWQRARILVAERRPFLLRRDDLWTGQAMAYVRALARCGAPEPLECPHPKWAALHAAHRLSTEDGPQRWEVQARLLAGQADPEIACRCAVPADTVCWFEALFFCVRDRLPAPRRRRPGRRPGPAGARGRAVAAPMPPPRRTPRRRPREQPPGPAARPRASAGPRRPCRPGNAPRDPDPEAACRAGGHGAGQPDLTGQRPPPAPFNTGIKT